MPANFSMQATHAIHRPAAADGQIGHVETLGRVVRILAAQGQQIVECQAELFLGIPTEVLLDESRSETIKARSHRRMGCEKISRARSGQRHFKRLRVLLHETAGALQHGKSRMTFIQVTDFRFDAQCGEQPPAANPEEQFLLEAQFRPAPIKLARDPAMRRKVRRVIAVQQVKFDSTDLDLPGAQPDRVTRQRDLQPQPLSVRLTQRRDRQLSGIVIRIERLLRSVLVNHLAKIALLVEQPHTDHRHAEVAGGFELVTGHIAQPA